MDRLWTDGPPTQTYTPPQPPRPPYAAPPAYPPPPAAAARPRALARRLRRRHRVRRRWSPPCCSAPAWPTTTTTAPRPRRSGTHDARVGLRQRRARQPRAHRLRRRQPERRLGPHRRGLRHRLPRRQRRHDRHQRPRGRRQLAGPGALRRTTASFHDARVLGVDASTDLAALKVDASAANGVKPLALADSDKVQVGDTALAIGYPLGLDRTATAGIVSGLERDIQAPNGFSIDKVIQTDAPINPGNSGGPLLNSNGEVIGVNSQIATAGGGNGSVGIGFAVPANTVKEVLPAARARRRARARLPRRLDRAGPGRRRAGRRDDGRRPRREGRHPGRRRHHRGRRRPRAGSRRRRDGDRGQQARRQGRREGRAQRLRAARSRSPSASGPTSSRELPGARLPARAGARPAGGDRVRRRPAAPARSRRRVRRPGRARFRAAAHAGLAASRPDRPLRGRARRAGDRAGAAGGDGGGADRAGDGRAGDRPLRLDARHRRGAVAAGRGQVGRRALPRQRAAAGEGGRRDLQRPAGRARGADHRPRAGARRDRGDRGQGRDGERRRAGGGAGSDRVAAAPSGRRPRWC